MSNCVNNKQILEKALNEDSSLLSNSTNTSFNDNLIQDISTLKSKEIFLISKNFESKIPELLSYLQNESNSIQNKLLILKYLENLFTKITYNSEIFSNKFSNDKEKLNLFQIIINQYITTPSDKDDYLRELNGLFSLLISQITLDKDTYHYIFSFLINYINKCNNNGYINENLSPNSENNLTSEQLSRIFQLLQIYYQSMQNIDEPHNYFYFNGESDNYISILNKDDIKTHKKILNINESLNIIMFIKLVPSQIIRQVYPIINYKIFDVIFNVRNKMISIGIDKENFLITNFTSEKLAQLKENKILSLLIKLNFKEIEKTEIFVNNEKVEIPRNIIIEEKDKKFNSKDKLEIKELKFFKNFIGICSNIIIYKESEKDKKNEGLPKFFTLKQKGWSSDSKETIILKPIYLNGFYKEELCNIITKQELKEKIDEKNIKELNFSIKDKSGENEIKEFLEKNLIAIYIPHRVMLPENQENKSYRNCNQIILKDSISNLDADFYINSPGLNGVHILNKFSEDFSPLGGLNHFLPIIEIITNNEELLLNENLSNFFNLITSVFMISYLDALKIENYNSNFFFNLSYFLEKIPDFYFENQLALKLISISSFLISLNKNYNNLIQQFHNYILLNENILFKFEYEDQAIILEQIKKYIDCSQNNFSIDIMLIINILLHYDKERYNKFCCKFHSDYFNEPCDVLSPELNFLLHPVEEIITKIIEKFVKEASLCNAYESECEIGKKLFKIFEMLTIDISPCLQKVIINQFHNYMEKHCGKYFAFLDVDRQMLDITLFIFKTSIFDVKIDALNLLFFMNKIKENMDEFYTNRSRTNSWAFKAETNVIDEEKAVVIQNYILPFYLLGDGILVSSSSSNSSSNNNDNFSNDFANIDIDKNIDKVSKKLPQEKNPIKLAKNFKKLNKNSMNKINKNDLDFDNFNKTITYNERNTFNITQNGRHFVDIKITSTEQKIYYNFKKKKIYLLISGLYNNIFKLFKEKAGFDFFLNLLIKLVSKSDIILINKFLEDLKNQPETKDKLGLIYDNHQFFHWLLETSFQIFMIKESNYDDKKFVPGFSIDPIDEDLKDKKHIFTEEEKKKKIDELYHYINEFISNIIKNNIYKLDYIITWSKYYYEMRNDKNNFEHVRNYVIRILRNSYKLPHEIPFTDKKFNESQKESIYFLNILFELLTFYKVNGSQVDKIKDSQIIDEELSINFPHILLLEINNENNKLTKNDIMKTLNIKWRDFPFYEKIYSFFKPLWMSLVDKKKKEDKEKEHINILKKYIGKKNIFINELELLFYSFNDVQEFHDSYISTIYANKGIKTIYMIFHFFILLFNVGGNETDIKNLYNDFRLFITLLIISSSTVTISPDIKKQKWPNESEYKDVKETTQLILTYTLNFFVNKIKEIDILISKYDDSKKDESLEKLHKYYKYVRIILIENLGYILKSLNLIYRENSGKIFSKVKNIFSNSEVIVKSGPYLFSKNIYDSIETKDTDNNNDNKDNFLDNILKLNIKKDSKELNSEFEKNINLFINSDKIKNVLSSYNKKKLYPFGKYIEKREKLIKNIIPIYDNRINSYEPQKNLCLVPHYWQECSYSKILTVKIGKVNKQLIKEIFVYKKKINLEHNEKINEYKKIKKKLFSFRGIWSKEEFFYEPKYHLKYKLVNHLTEDYTKILLTPILDLDYYLPTFSQFEKQNIFRKPEKKIPIYYLADLSFTLKDTHKSFLTKTTQNDKIKNKEEEKKNDEKEMKQIENKKTYDTPIQNLNINDNFKINQNIQVDNVRKSKKLMKKRLNALFDVKIANYSFFNKSNSTNGQIFTDSFLFSELISQKHLLNSTKNDIKVEACLIKTAFHISGIFYNNSKEIGFYSSERTFSNEEEDYDFDRKVCFGSIFKSQSNKYHCYYLKIPYSSIEFVLKRRYYFKKTVLEIFTINKKSYSFRFEEEKLKAVFENIRYYMKSYIEDISTEYTKYDDKIGFFNNNRILDNGIALPNIIKNMNLKNLYEKWTKWEISTLKFLMILNFYANRSYNDINQYPVFPWIITDYSSDSLPSPLPIRPMGTPMGMLDYTDEAKERKYSYKNSWVLNENEEEIDEDYDRYRSHYSTSLYVTYYLVRTFPFSSMRVELQGKNFDDPNRLFNSIFDSFNCALTQKSDLRELVPELYFFPEMFCNLNILNLGEIKNKETKSECEVNDILMPNWANNNAYTFISKHRMLLESPEINEKINEWFNIIFGSKQNGKEAKKIGNLFIRQSYESFADVYNKSEIKEKIYFCRMVEFGVTPHQILKYDSNKRINYNELKCKRNLFPNITEIIRKNDEKNLEITKVIPVQNEDMTINKHITPIKIFLHQKKEDDEEKIKIYILNEEGYIKILKNEQQLNKLNPMPYRKILSSKNLDFNFSEEKIIVEKLSKKISKIPNPDKKINLFLPRYRNNSKKTPNIFFNKGHCLALGGFWNGNILIENISSQTSSKNKEKNDYPETKIYSTKEYSPITHIIIDEHEIYAICGNILGTIFVYTINQDDKLDWRLYKVIYDHFSPITSLCINDNLNIFISCSKSGYCMLYSIPKFKLVNSFKLKNIINQNGFSNNENISLYPHISLISSSSLPCLIFYFKQINSLAVFSINGRFLNELKIDLDISPNEIKIFTDRQFIDYMIIFNNKNESIEIYSIIDLKKVMSWPIKNYIFIDFIFTKEIDSIFALVNCKESDEDIYDDNECMYKILVLKSSNILKGQNDFEPINIF